MFHVVAAPRFLEKGASWDGFAVECNHRTAGEGRFKVPQHVLGLALGHPHAADFAISSDKQIQRRMRPGDLQVVPANLSHWVRWEESDFVLLLLEPDLIAQSSADLGRSSSFEIVPRLQIRNPLIEQIVLALQREAVSGGSGGRLYAEALITVLSVELLRTSANPELPLHAPTAGPLSKATARRIADYIEDNLADDISLHELASMAGMGRQYFGQAFKNTFGRPPHQYVIARRLTRACQLLSDTRLSIAEIAYAVGFSSQSHLTTRFHMRYGITPRLYRLRS